MPSKAYTPPSGSNPTFRQAGPSPRSFPSEKKGKDAASMESYRPVSLVSLASKVLMLVMHARLAPMVDDTVGEHQHGFRSTRSTTDAIHTLRLIGEKYSQLRDRQLVICFIDLTRAFDRVSWELLWHSLRISGTPKPLIHALQLFYDRIEMRVPLDPSETDPGSFRPTAGVRQGCVPTLAHPLHPHVRVRATRRHARGGPVA